VVWCGVGGWCGVVWCGVGEWCGVVWVQCYSLATARSDSSISMYRAKIYNKKRYAEKIQMKKR